MLHLEERLRMGDEIMKTYIYEGGFGIVAKSGVGSAIKHQKNMLKQADIEEAKSWKEADIVHINTVFPDSVLAACLAKMQGKKVVYYGHSTMEDFRNSFIGSNRFAPLFKKWICFCYGLGAVSYTHLSEQTHILVHMEHLEHFQQVWVQQISQQEWLWESCGSKCRLQSNSY